MKIEKIKQFTVKGLDFSTYNVNKLGRRLRLHSPSKALRFSRVELLDLVSARVKQCCSLSSIPMLRHSSLARLLALSRSVTRDEFEVTFRGLLLPLQRNPRGPLFSKLNRFNKALSSGSMTENDSSGHWQLDAASSAWGSCTSFSSTSWTSTSSRFHTSRSPWQGGLFPRWVSLALSHSCLCSSVWDSPSRNNTSIYHCLNIFLH